MLWSIVKRAGGCTVPISDFGKCILIHAGNCEHLATRFLTARTFFFPVAAHRPLTKPSHVCLTTLGWIHLAFTLLSLSPPSSSFKCSRSEGCRPRVSTPPLGPGSSSANTHACTSEEAGCQPHLSGQGPRSSTLFHTSYKLAAVWRGGGAAISKHRDIFLLQHIDSFPCDRGCGARLPFT